MLIDKDSSTLGATVCINANAMAVASLPKPCCGLEYVRLNGEV